MLTENHTDILQVGLPELRGEAESHESSDKSGGGSVLMKNREDVFNVNEDTQDFGSKGTALTGEPSNDDADLRELNGGELLNSDAVLPTDKDKHVERDNDESLVERGYSESLAPLGDIHSDGNNKIEKDGIKKSGAVFKVNNLIKGGDSQLENGATASASEEKVSGKEGGDKKRQTKTYIYALILWGRRRK